MTKNYPGLTMSIQKLCTGLMFLLCATTVTLAQSLSIYNVDASKFPRVTASYIAFDTGGEPLTGLQASDFRVVERQYDGTPVDVTPVLDHDCETLTTDPEASVILILDRSNSMRDVVNGKERFEYAKDAIRAFVNQMRFNGETRVCLVTFTGNYEVAVDWTNDKNAVETALQDMQPLTATDYTLPFRNPGNNIYEKFRERPANIPKFAFFLTDGYPNPGIDDEVKFVNENTDSLARQAIRFFAITIVQRNTHWTIERLAENSGGKSIVTDEENLVDLFSLLALETRIREVCTLTWTAPYGCVEPSRNRTAQITLLRGSNPQLSVPYLAPPWSVAGATLSEPVVFCGDPLPNGTGRATVTITAKNARMNITGFSINPNTNFTVYDWNVPTNDATFRPFSLNAGQSRTIGIEFKQGAQQIFRQALLELEGSPCPPSIPLVGGQGLVVLTAPNGGELFSTCDTVTISWAGVLPTQPVTLEYSENDGSTWNSISNNATGLSFKWIPPRPGTRYKVRVKVSPVPQYQWAERIGGTSNETATAVSVSDDDLKVFTTGHYDGPSQFGTTNTTNTAGDIDGYFNEWSSDGRLVRTVLLDGAGTNADRVMGVVHDDIGNYYVVGDFASTSATFGSLGLTKGAGDASNMFVIKYGPDGSILWQNYGQGSGLNTSFANARRVGYRRFNGALQVVVQGVFERFIRVGLSAGGAGFEDSPRYNNNNRRNYYVIYTEDGRATLFANATPDNSWTMQDLKDTDSQGFEYETGDYTGVKNFSPPAITLANNGGSDVFLSKFGSIPPSEDESEQVFTVSAPRLEFTVPTITMDATAQGQASSKSFTEILCNTGDHPVEIASTQFVGGNNTDFRLISPPVGTRIAPGECQTIEVEFNPTGVGQRTSSLEIAGACGSVARVTINGEGTAPCSYDVRQTVDLGNIPLGTVQSFPIGWVLRNTGTETLAGTFSATASPTITVTAPGNPSPFSLAQNQEVLVTVDVNATTVGQQTITFSFDLPAECGTPTVDVTYTGVAPDVNISSVNYGQRRLGTTTPDVVRISNNSSEAVNIISVVLSDPANPNFVFTNIPGAAFTLASNDSRDINVDFVPQTRGAHSVRVVATVQGKTETLEGTVEGVGILPAIAATGYTFAAASVGIPSAEIGEVVIRNTDTQTPLVITNIDFDAPTADFAWVTAPAGFPLSIAPGAEERYSVTFTPQASGNRSALVRITHDAILGTPPPFADTLVMVAGIGFEGSDLPPVLFGDVLACATRTRDVTIVNPNPAAPLACQAPVGSGDIAAFQLSETGAFVIPPGGTRTITVTYTPTIVGPQAASYVIENDQDISLVVNASGVGITTNADFRFYNIIEGQVGQVFSTPIDVTLGDIEGAKVDEVVLTLTYPSDYVQFQGTSPVQPAGWTWVPTEPTPGVLVLTGTSDAGTTLASGNVVIPQFNLFLTAEETVAIDMQASTSLQCIVPTGHTASVSISNVCFAQGRLVKIGEAQFGIIRPSPNPSSATTVIGYSTGIKLATTFEVVDGVGNVVKRIDTPVLESGEYELILDTSDIAAGMYYVRMTSGPFLGSQQLLVVK